MARYPFYPSDDDGAWVDLPQLRPYGHLVPGHDADEPGPPPSPEDDWIVPLRDPPGAADSGRISAWWFGIRDRLPGRAWAVLAATIAVLAGALMVSVDNTGDGGEPVQATAVPPSPTTTALGPCEGLSGAVVTDRAGDPATLAGAIASFEAAYYIDRDATKAMPLLAPETGITAEALAAGIVSIPPGTRHCVAITPITPSTANVHIAELRPDGQRIDYLQLINTRPADTGAAVLIANIQKRG
ncbi:hypothetical protein [Nocardia brevicatena]|uniref:hypothetical protein n=1 Tax=Nocardia brevicatena TaxID=37327 RepID=UPI0002FE090D|nr:hypothetical protein [Nocardia brevicatena]